MADTIEHYRSQVAIARTEIKNLRQQLSALKNEHMKEIKMIKATLSGLRCANCADSATTIIPIENNENRASTSGAGNTGSTAPYHPIGVIETSFQNKRGVPRQPSVMAKAKGTVVIDTTVFNNPEHALSGLEEFSHMWIIFHFHKTESNSSVPAMVAPPRLAGARRGVLSTRSPHRPCPIGLSLVQIQSIEGNKIHFLGVDMINGTPVLDIKPYIPQYDYPAPFGENMSSLERPPTEGISDAADMLANLSVGDDGYDDRSLSPRLTHPMGIDTTSPLPRSPFEADVPSQDTPSNAMTNISPSPDSPSTADLLDITARSPMRRPDSERGAPDGQERFTPPQSALTNITHDGIRVAPWISDPPIQAFEVRFTEDVNERLVDLIGERAQTFKNNIQSLLSEDPRSNYVRTRYPDHEYSCVLEDLSISCIFDSSSSVCTIIAVRNAEDMQS